MAAGAISQIKRRLSNFRIYEYGECTFLIFYILVKAELVIAAASNIVELTNI